MSTPQALVVMGVSGAGKTTVGQAFAARLGWPFLEGDDFHPPANLAKMAEGQPLDDADRAPWLARLNQLLQDQLAEGINLVVACSALKAEYRAQLRAGIESRVRFVYLKGDYALIHQRMQGRPGHFMRPDMLQSQFEALEVPDEAVVVDVAESVDQIVEELMVRLALIQ